VKTDADAVVAWLRRTGTRRGVEGMARYGLPSDRAFGVPVGIMQKEAKRIGRDHALAEALWATGWYEARMMSAFLGEPERLTVARMNAWARDFDNWGITDTVCLHLFDRTPLAWGRLAPWARSPREFVKRAAFALAAGLSLHDKAAPDARLLAFLPAVEEAAGDDRNFVKKGVNWALRTIGRRSRGLNMASVAVARRLAGSGKAAPRWVGKDALRELTSAAVRARLASR
jgi:3-methyladenine DNA glycosylase AlkD